MQASMRCVLYLLILLVFTACGDGDVERRRRLSLERMGWSGGTSGDQRVQRLLVAALEQADEASLQEPRLVNVSMRVVPDDTPRGSLRVEWIAATPTAAAVRIRFSDGDEHDIAFDPAETAEHLQEAKDLVVYVGTLTVERDHPLVWAKLLTSPTASVVLLSGGEPISDEASIHRTTLQG